MIIVDVEIRRAILGRGETPIPDIEYCQGWRDFAGMGIACVATYDTATHLSGCYFEEDLNALSLYLHKKPTAGFNTKRFDNLLLAQHGVVIDESIHYDMLEQIWLALGLNPDKFNPRTHGGWGLDAVCGATLGIHKTGHGAAAPVWWQQGRRGKVVSYCLNDVWMEGQLLLHIMEHGMVANPKELAGSTLRVARPQSALRGLLDSAALSPHDPDVNYPERKATVFAVASAADNARQRLDEPAPQVSPGGLGIIR